MTFLKDIKLEWVEYYKCIIMVEVLVGMRKLRAEWNHRLESS